MAAQSKQVAAIGMDGRSAIIGRRRSSGRSASAVGTCFVTCNGKTEITESVQIVQAQFLTNPMVWSVFDEGGDPH